MKKLIITVLLLISLLLLTPASEAGAAKKNKIKLSTKTISLEKGTAARLKVENSDEAVVWS